MNLNFEKTGMFLSLEGYDPRRNTTLPDGFTAEYYGDDIIYIGYGGACVSQIWPDDGTKNDTNKTKVVRNEGFDLLPEDVQATIATIEARLSDAISEVDDKYAIESFAGRHLMGKT